MVSLSIVILNYKTRGLLKQCLNGLRKFPPAISHEIIVIDNDSQDGSCEMIRSEYSEVKLIASDKNIGHASGNNLGIREAKGDYILLLNTDIVIFDYSIDKLYNFMVANSNVGIVGGKLYDPSKSLQFSCLGFPKLLTPFYRRTLLGKFNFGKKELERYLMLDFDHRTARRVDWMMSSCMMITRKCIEKIGLMDQRYFVYFADTDWCRSAWQNHFEVWYYPDASFVHYYKRESATGLLFLNKIARIHIHDWFKYILKWGIASKSVYGTK